MTTASTTTITPLGADTLRAPTNWDTRWQDYYRVMTHTHTFSGQADHGGTVPPPRSYQMLVEWADRMGIAALGMGSPYTPGLANNFRLYDRKSPHLYYDPSFDQMSVRGDDEIQRMLDEINAVSNGRTWFYLDNETPKGRYGHLWWVGYDLDFPAWHDYDQVFDRWMCTEATPGDPSDEPMPYERRPYREIVAMQRRAGALGFWAHPTSWWRDKEGRFITNIATEMPAHAIADGYVDGMVIMGYRSWRPEYMAVWFMLLDAGFRVTGVAEEDASLSSEPTWQRTDARTNHVCLNGDDLGTQALVRGFASGRLAATNGPMIDLAVDGVPMGSIARTAAGKTHRVTIWIDPQGTPGLLDLVGRGGKVICQQEVNGPTVANVEIDGSEQRGYVLARFRVEPTHRHSPAAVSNPVYLHPRGQGFEKPAQTRLRLTITPDSPFHGGQIRFEQADGERIGSANLRAETIDENLPASGRFTLITPDGKAKTEYLINANTELTQLQRYLYRGRFLQDFPHIHSGDVPVEAWRLNDFVQAMREVVIGR